MTSVRDRRTRSRAPRSLWICGQLLRSSPTYPQAQQQQENSRIFDPAFRAPKTGNSNCRRRKEQLTLTTSASRSVVESVTQQLESLPQIHEAIQAAVALPSIELPKVAKDIVGGMNLLGSAVAELESRFSLPDAAEVTSLLGSPYVLPSAEGIALSPELMPELQRSLSMVTVPWLDVEDKARSISGLCDLQYLGYVLSTSPPFDLDVSDRLRQSLGDWREEIDWPSSIFTDPLARSDFYRERGLDPALTDFPAPAFYEGTRIAGLKLDLPPLVPEYHPESDREEEETGFVRTNAAHDRLLRFETQLRRFIDKAMRAEFGDGWIKRQVSEDIRNGWHRKQQRDQEDGIRDHPLIAYAEFTHYEQIITRKRQLATGVRSDL